MWAVDRGIVSKAPLKWLRERTSRYIAGTPKNPLRAFERELLAGDRSLIRDGLEERLKPTADAETYILCRLADRAAKEQGMRDPVARPVKFGLIHLAATCSRRPQPVGLK